MRVVRVGTLESNDCIITIIEAEKLIVEVNSVVYDFFGEQIENLIWTVLNDLKLDHVKVICDDKGALDYTIKSRLLTAIERLGELS